MTLKQLKAFLVLARVLNYANAADELCLSQSALSLTIKALEEELGGKLFKRTTRLVNLTHEGHALIPYARKLLANWEDMEKDVKQRFQLHRGNLNIASMPFATHSVLPGVLQAFSKQYPNINFSIHDVPNEKIIENIQDGLFEIGICFEPPLRHAVTFQSLFKEDFVAIVPKDHVLAQHKTISMAELCSYPFVTLQKPSIVRHVIDQCCQKHQLLLDLKVECHQISSLSHFVASGMGVTAIPRHFQPLIDLQQCVVIEISEGNVQLNLGIMYKTDTALSNISNQFIELITHYPFSTHC